MGRTLKRNNKNKTKSNKNSKPYIILEKYTKTVFNVKLNMYILKFNTNYECKNFLTLKKKTDYIKRGIYKKSHLFGYLTQDKVLSKKINKRDANIMKKLISEINVNDKYTFCLNNDNLIFVETKTSENNSFVKDWLSKHIMICNKTACASGEMVIHNNTFIFDNSSGTFKPTLENLKSLKEAMPFLKIKLLDMGSESHEKYFGALTA
jgi:hypothetical protein